MKSDKLAIIFILTVLIAGAAYYFSEKQTKTVGDQEGGAVFIQGLMGKINQIAKIQVTEKSATTSLVLKNDQWVVEEKAGYGADFAKVKKLLLGLAELKTIESKTSKAENYGRLGVQGVGEPGEEESKQIQLSDKAGNVLYTLLVGKSKSSRSPGGKSSIYVRKLHEAKTWLVSGKIEVPRTQVDWLSKSIIDIAPSRIRSVNIRQPGSAELLISKQSKEDENYSVENLPNNAELKSINVADSIASSLQNLSFEDVRARGGFQAEDKDISLATFITFDGLILNAKLIKRDNKFFFWLDTKSDGKNEKIAAESSKLNSQFALWVYEIQSFKASGFQKKLADLLKVEEIVEKKTEEKIEKVIEKVVEEKSEQSVEDKIEEKIEEKAEIKLGIMTATDAKSTQTEIMAPPPVPKPELEIEQKAVEK